MMYDSGQSRMLFFHYLIHVEEIIENRVAFMAFVL
jgi:hypothetical protein